jgi:hypothetical protein
VAANNPEAIARLQCPCGKNIRHRRSCRFRMGKSLRGTSLSRLSHDSPATPLVRPLPQPNPKGATHETDSQPRGASL